MAETSVEAKRMAREAEEWAKKQKLLEMSEISLVLRSYDDIFSDFDPRPIERRSLSDDFLVELRHAVKEKKAGVIEVNFLIPLEQRKTDKEAKIKKRLKEHFRKHYEDTNKEIAHVRKKGVSLVVIGFALSIVGAFFVIPSESLVSGTWIQAAQRILTILIEPAAWFTIWTGFEEIFTTWKDMEPDLEFHHKMSKTEVNFTGY